MPERDFLDEVIDERTERNPEFPALVAAAERRRELLAALARRRREHEQSQTAVAAAMRSSQSSIARLETSATDARLSTLDRYAHVLGYRVEYTLVPEDPRLPDSRRFRLLLDRAPVSSEEIRAALTEWLDDAATNPMTGAPFVVAEVDTDAVFDYLIGSYRGSEAPEHGVRSYLVDLKLTLAPEQSEADMKALLATLETDAGNDPSLGGRLGDKARARLGAHHIGPENRAERQGPLITQQVVVSVVE
jgi:transcriptional regulator with XRE-family HTH domain